MESFKAAIRNGEKTAVIIDGSNLFGVVKQLTFNVDYKKLYDIFSESCDLFRIYYVTAILETDKDDNPNPLTPLLDWLAYNRYMTITKAAKQIKYTRDGKDFERTKGNVDVEIAILIAKLSDHVDHIVLCSGDGDFVSAVQFAQENGTRVSILHSIKTQIVMMSDELRRQADAFIELEEMKHSIRTEDKPREVVINNAQ